MLTDELLKKCSIRTFRMMLTRREDWEDLLERQAIAEYDGKLSRSMAEMVAIEDVTSGRFGSPKHRSEGQSGVLER